MSSRSAQPTQQKTFPTWVIVTTIIIVIILTILLIVTWVSLQECIKDARNNVCQNSVGTQNLVTICCADTSVCESRFPGLGYTCIAGTCTQTGTPTST